VTNVARLLRGLLPVLAASVTAAAPALTAQPAAAVPRAAAPASEWWLAALHVPAAAQTGTAGKGVTVAVLSTGVDAGHPDLTGTVTAGPDFAMTGRKPGGPYWGAEGTAVASLIAGHGHGAHGADGITGIAPGARILSVQVTLEYDDPLNLDAAVTRGLPAAIAAGIRYAVGHGAGIIALPLDPGTLQAAPGADPAAAGGSAAERAAVSYALARDVVLVAPAGDNGAGTNAVNYPAAYPGVLAVGATDQNGQLALFTGAHSYVALTAPGAGLTPGVPVTGTTAADPAAGLMVAAPDGGYQPLASTDMSAALTAGAAALIRSRYPRLTVAEVTQALEHGATPLPDQAPHAPAAGSGHGELNVAAALSSAAAIAAAHPAPAPSSSPTVRPTVPRTAHPAHSAQPGQTDPGRLLRSLVTGLAVAAGVLIAGLIVAITLARIRRRARSRAPAGVAAANRPGRNAGQPRHARRQTQALPPAPGPARTEIWPSGPPHRRTHPTAPAAPLALPPAFSRAQPKPEQPKPAKGDAPLAPWELSPEEFAAAPLQEDVTQWRISNTGPMYVWNPNSTTGPLFVVSDDDEQET
jgi:subtilisin family serine protease